jgi:hypothetical protein
MGNTGHWLVPGGEAGQGKFCSLQPRTLAGSYFERLKSRVGKPASLAASD